MLRPGSFAPGRLGAGPPLLGRPGFAAEGMGPVSFWIACCCCCCFCCCCCCCFGTGRLGVAPPETPADSPVPSVGLTLLLLGVSCCRARHESSPRVSGCFCCCCCCCCCCFATGRLGAAPPLLSGLGSLAADRLAAGLPVLPGSFAPVRLGAGWPGCWDACGAGCASVTWLGLGLGLGSELGVEVAFFLCCEEQRERVRLR